MNGIPMRVALLLGLGICLAGCETGQVGPPPLDPAVIAAHEWDHGPPWGPEEPPWVAPPADYALFGPGYYGPSPWYWGPSVGVGVGFGLRRGHWWGGHRGFVGRGFGGPRFHGGGGGRRGHR